MSFKASLYSKLEELDVCLINPPFSDVNKPSIALGILKAVLNGTDLRSFVVYANLLFAEKIGIERYQRVMNFSPRITNLQDWIFSSYIFSDYVSDDLYFNHISNELVSFAANMSSSPVTSIELSKIKRELIFVKKSVAEFIDELVDAILKKKPKIVACTSVFFQHLASLSLLKRIKDVSPETITIIGGGNCSGKLGLATVREFSWIDYIFSGEADEVFYSLCKLLISKKSSIDYKCLSNGVFNKVRANKFIESEDESVLYGIVKKLDDIPRPDYEDYFITLKSMSYYDNVKDNLLILIESSRGCWWKKCTFCGLNHFRKDYRKKKHENILAEIIYFTEKYDVDRIQFVDNILPMSYFNDLIPALSKYHKKLKIFFETKANLNKDHIQAFAIANIRWIQPGIENLHDDMLSLMKKGNTAINNIKLLKYAVEYGVAVMWNMLVNCPRENICWIEKLTVDLPLFHHLQPPRAMSHISFQRFSEYYDNSELYNLKLRPLNSLKYIYPVSEDKLANFAYYFQDIQLDRYSVENEKKYDQLDREISIWRKEFFKNNPAKLVMTDNVDAITIIDSRNCAPTRYIKLDGIDANIVRIAEHGIHRDGIFEQLNNLYDKKHLDEEINTAIDSLKDKKIIYEHSDVLIALPVSNRAFTPLNIEGEMEGPDYSVYLKD